MTKYTLELTPEQLSVVKRACEFYSRIRIGQLEELDHELVFYSCFLDDMERLDEFRQKLDELRKIVFPDGINRLKRDKPTEISWNAYQSMRYAEAWHNNPNGNHWSVCFDKPLDIGGVGVPKCEALEETSESD